MATSAWELLLLTIAENKADVRVSNATQMQVNLVFMRASKIGMLGNGDPDNKQL